MEFLKRRDQTYYWIHDLIQFLVNHIKFRVWSVKSSFQFCSSGQRLTGVPIGSSPRLCTHHLIRTALHQCLTKFALKTAFKRWSVNIVRYWGIPTSYRFPIRGNTFRQDALQNIVSIFMHQFLYNFNLLPVRISSNNTTERVRLFMVKAMQ